MISPVPDVKTLDIDPQSDSFMILACDGIWNSMSSQEVVDFVHPRLMSLKPGEKLSSICEEVRFFSKLFVKNRGIWCWSHALDFLLFSYLITVWHRIPWVMEPAVTTWPPLSSGLRSTSLRKKRQSTCPLPLPKRVPIRKNAHWRTVTHPRRNRRKRRPRPRKARLIRRVKATPRMRMRLPNLK